MPSPKRASPDDFFSQLTLEQQPHLQKLREISLSYADRVSEELRWNVPAYLADGENLWMLQAFKQHCSLRFSPAFFQQFREAAVAAGYEAGAGFLKILYTEPVPEDLCRQMIEARLS